MALSIQHARVLATAVTVCVAPLAQAQGAAVGAPSAQVKHFGAMVNTSFFRGGRTVFGPLTAEETARRGAAMAGAAFVVAVLMLPCGRRGLTPGFSSNYDR